MLCVGMCVSGVVVEEYLPYGMVDITSFNKRQILQAEKWKARENVLHFLDDFVCYHLQDRPA